MKITPNMLQASKGERPAELVLKNGQVLNLFTRELLPADVAVCSGQIVGVGSYSGEQEVDCTGKTIVPGFIDAHLHIESSMVTPARFAGVVAPWGTTTLIADPHEIANVAGLAGIEYMLGQTGLPLNLYVMLPSCVPATPFEDSGAVLTAEELIKLKDHPNVLGLGEMMNFPGVLAGDSGVYQKLEAFDGRVIDGHAPMLSGRELQAYRLAGILDDHECSCEEEVLEKLRTGMFLSVREGSAAKNLDAILQTALKHNLGFDRMAFCTDDKHIGDIEREGHISYSVKRAIELGVNLFDAYRMSSYNAAQFYGLCHLGAVAPGYQADLVLLDDVQTVSVCAVYHGGKLVSQKKSKPETAAPPCPNNLLHSVNPAPVSKGDLQLPLDGTPFPCIEMIPNQILTKCAMEIPPAVDGLFVPQGDYRKIAVIERHHATGKLGIGVLKGFPVNGAIASTVGHDSHNLIVIGSNDADMLAAIDELKRCQGGFTIVQDGRVLGTLPLPVCGLMTDEDTGLVEQKLAALLETAHSAGIPRSFEPFIALSFLALPVIPEIRLTDRGIVRL